MDFLINILKKQNSMQEQKKDEPIQNIYLNRISQIFQASVDQAKPHFIFIKSTILIIVLCLVVYFIYDLFQDFKNEMVIAFLSGIAYKKMRQNFISIFQKQQQKDEKKEQKTKPVFKIIGLSIIFFILPWLRRYSKYNYSSHMLDINKVLQSFLTSTNIIIRIAQLYLFINIIRYLFGSKIKRYFSYQRLTEKRRNRLGILFACLLFIFLAFLMFFLTIILVNETTRLVNFSVNKFQTTMDCELSRNLTQGNFTKRPCSQIISNNVLENLTKINNQTKIDICINNLIQYQYYFSFLQRDFDDYVENICFLKQKAEQISPNYLNRLSIQDTTNIIFTIFEEIITIGAFFSNSLYSITIFLSIFIVTVTYFDFDNTKFSILGKRKNEIIQNITGIISATIFIAIQHLVYGIFIFQIFRFSDINILISILLSIVAFVPMVTPHFIMIIAAMITYYIRGNLITCIICSLYYYWMSGRVYERNYSAINVNKVLINLSVIFGIYKYGISGIIYGPLLILLFQFVYEQLFPEPL